MNKLDRAALVASLAMTHIMVRDVSAPKKELRRQRLSYLSQDNLGWHRAWKLLEEIHRAQVLKEPVHSTNRQLLDSPSITREPQRITKGTTRTKAQEHIDILEKWVIGDDGHLLFSQGLVLVTDDDVLYRLLGWLTPKETSSTLWISSPDEADGALSGSRAAALATVTAAW